MNRPLAGVADRECKARASPVTAEFPRKTAGFDDPRASRTTNRPTARRSAPRWRSSAGTFLRRFGRSFRTLGSLALTCRGRRLRGPDRPRENRAQGVVFYLDLQHGHPGPRLASVRARVASVRANENLDATLHISIGRGGARVSPMTGRRRAGHRTPRIPGLTRALPRSVLIRGGLEPDRPDAHHFTTSAIP